MLFARDHIDPRRENAMLTPIGWMLVGVGATGSLVIQFLGKMALKPLGLFGGQESYFAPSGGCANILSTQVGKAKREVLLLTPTLQSKGLMEALAGAAGRGVAVEVLLPNGAEKTSGNEIQALLSVGGMPYIAQESRVMSTILLVDHHILAVGSVNQNNPGEPGVIEHLHVWKGNADLNNKHREFISNHKGQAKPLGEAKPAVPLAKPAAPAVQAPQPSQSAQVSIPGLPPGVDPNNPGALLQAAREAAGRGDQAAAAALLEAAKQANQRMQVSNGVRVSA